MRHWMHRRRREVGALLDGELGDDRGCDVLAHLDACPQCAQYAALLLGVRAALRSRHASSEPLPVVRLLRLVPNLPPSL